jgi:hypothetical protein
LAKKTTSRHGALDQLRGGEERIKMEPSDNETDLVSTTMDHDDQDNDNDMPAISEGMTSAIGNRLGRLRPTNRRMMVIGAGGSAMLVIGAIQLAGRRRASSDR